MMAQDGLSVVAAPCLHACLHAYANAELLPAPHHAPRPAAPDRHSAP
eukprot:CAMPEP_0182577720 /NCGR_PEP_ID=MMETSP1324-20130603/38695_1 /TAXON_ID=236786 /ORGANISM="Florenciella sp., Strain RCC1587" /LENGTH=46 /DNA_ID= /DNA_START= /DNA_END= /DNA_ORIENTATION=